MIDSRSRENIMKEEIKRLIQSEIDAIGNIPLDNDYKGAIQAKRSTEIWGSYKMVTYYYYYLILARQGKFWN